jgi:N-acyl-D-aspartate/D-glutamate deacylase
VSEFDLVIRSGVVIDGTGAEGRQADVAVSAGTVVEVGPVQGRGHREIDADGAVVIPGFVDIHTHYDGQAVWDERLQPSSWHGVTTVVAGNCGVGFAPVRPENRQALIDLMEGVEDIPGTALHEGLSWDWESFAEYVQVLERRNRDVDLAVQVPHAALRFETMGERAVAKEPATDREISEMAALAQQAIRSGALGFTTSRTLLHRSRAGSVTPTYGAEKRELVAIVAAVGKMEAGVLQLVTDFDNVDEDFDIMRAMAEVSGRQVSVSLVQFHDRPGLYREILARLSTANEDGYHLIAQVAARGTGILYGLQCSLHPFVTNLVWRSLRHLSVEEQAARMQDPSVKTAMLAAQTRDKLSNQAGGLRTDRYGEIYELADPPDYEPAANQSLEARARAAGRDILEFVYDIVVADGGRRILYSPASNFADQNLDAVREMLVHPYTVPGLSDGGAHVGSICDGSFPTTLLQHWARDRSHDRIPLPSIVKLQTRDTARAVGLRDRGQLAPGYKADLNVVDFDTLRLHRPTVNFDLPAGGRRLLQRVDGYRHTVVSGIETYRNGEPTGDLPGRVIRGATKGA